MKNLNKITSSKLISYANASLYLFVLGFLFWSCFRGFDWTDESYYLLSYRYPEDVTKGVTFFHIYLGYIFKLLNYDIVLLRIAGILLLQLSSLVFWIGFFKIAQPEIEPRSDNRRFPTFCDYSFIGLGALLAYSWYLPTPSYNSLNAILVNVCTGLYFVGMKWLQNTPIRWRNVGVCFFFCGVFIGISFFIKFTTGIALLSLFVFASVVWPGLFAAEKYPVAIFLAAGMLFCIMTHYFLFGEFTDCVNFATKGVELISTLETNYGVSSLSRYLLELKGLFIASLSSFWVLYICLLMLAGFFVGLKRVRGQLTKKYYLAFVIFLILSVVTSIYRGQYMGGVSRFHQLAEFYLSLIILLSVIIFSISVIDHRSNSSSQKKNKTLVLTIVLFGLPFVGTFGTGNPIYSIVPYYIASWFAIFILLCRKYGLLFGSKTVQFIFMLCISCFTAAQIISGCLIYPYRLNSGVFDQIIKTSIGNPASVLKLDEQSSRFVRELRKISEKNSFKAGDDMLVFYNLPGAVFSIGARSPGVPWYFGSYEKGFKRFAEKALADVPIDRIKNAFLLQNSSDASKMPDFSFFGIDFPGDYFLCGQLDSPYTGSTEKYFLWKPKLKSADGSSPS